MELHDHAKNGKIVAVIHVSKGVNSLIASMVTDMHRLHLSRLRNFAAHWKIVHQQGLRTMIDNPDSQRLKQTVEAQHGGKATLAQTLLVREYFFGRPNWEGVVHIFDLVDHPKATRAYAWSSPAKDSTEPRMFSVLQTDSIISPKDAIRAAVAAEYHRVEQAPTWWRRSFKR